MNKRGSKKDKVWVKEHNIEQQDNETIRQSDRIKVKYEKHKLKWNKCKDHINIRE